MSRIVSIEMTSLKNLNCLIITNAVRKRKRQRGKPDLRQGAAIASITSGGLLAIAPLHLLVVTSAFGNEKEEQKKWMNTWSKLFLNLNPNQKNFVSNE